MFCVISKRISNSIFLFLGITFISASLLHSLNSLSIAIFVSLIYLSISAVFVVIEKSSKKEKRTTPLRRFVKAFILIAPISFFLFGQTHDIIQSEIVERSYFNGMLSIVLVLLSILFMVVIIGISFILSWDKKKN
jgi:membrane protease YdiL (CAAX protease family)